MANTTTNKANTMAKHHHHHLLLLLLLTILSLSHHHHHISASPTHFSTTTIPTTTTNPLSPKAALLRYWTRKITNTKPKPNFLLSKASPLSAPDAALYERLASTGQLPARLRPFCSAANLACSPDLSLRLDKKGGDADFASYNNIDFSNYGTAKSGGFDSFKNYSDGRNIPVDTFRRYGRDSVGHDERFAFYAPDGNVVTANFTSYATGADGGSGDFTSYHHFGNDPDLKFTNYDSNAGGGRKQTFSSYSEDTNAGDQSFAGYGKSADAVPMSFKGYAKNSNVMGSTFTGYDDSAASSNDTFASYGFNGNTPENNFRSYGHTADGAVVETFTSYRDHANVGDDTFQSYAENTEKSDVEFTNYGQTANVGSDTFRRYSAGGDPTVGFKIYGFNNTFKDYTRSPGITFKSYRNTPAAAAAAAMVAEVRERVESSSLVNRWVEPGKFFRESKIKEGTVMPMPDIRDKMPVRSFLPRSISSKIPFSTARLDDLNRVFNARPDTGLAKAMSDTVAECERAPSRGETKRCTTSVEDMIDFATTVLGADIVVRSTETTRGSGENVKISRVHGINGGNMTKSVSCHQSLFPYMVYYCHSVPKVRAYEAEIMAIDSKEVINHGVAICHLDTSDWSPGHGAFVALGSGPGKIEVCHWIFEGDMTWAVAD